MTDTVDNSKLSFKKRFLLAQSEIKHIKKDAKNPHFKSEYTSLPEALESILPVLQKYDLIHRTSTEVRGSMPILITYIEDVHSDAQYKTELPLLETSNMQKIGSSITYSQRYNVLGILGLCAGIDDDGNIASGVVDVQQRSSTAPKPLNIKPIPPTVDEKAKIEKAKKALQELIDNSGNRLSQECVAEAKQVVDSRDLDGMRTVYSKIQSAIKKSLENAINT